MKIKINNLKKKQDMNSNYRRNLAKRHITNRTNCQKNISRKKIVGNQKSKI